MKELPFQPSTLFTIYACDLWRSSPFLGLKPAAS